MRLALLLSILVTGCRAPGDDAAVRQPRTRDQAPASALSPAPLPAPPPGALKVTAHIRQHLGVGWAHVLDVVVEGDRTGGGSLYVPAGDTAALACALDDARQARAVLELQLSPSPPPDAMGGGPYRFHLQLRGDGGTSYWAVDACRASR